MIKEEREKESDCAVEQQEHFKRATAVETGHLITSYSMGKPGFHFVTKVTNALFFTTLIISTV